MMMMDLIYGPNQAFELDDLPPAVLEDIHNLM
jgi:hypothetical protein